jgi:predicted nucleic acid-binding protein
MKVYADTNVITRFYLSAEGEDVTSIGGGLSEPLPVFWLLQAEVINAFEQSVFTGFGETRTRISAELASASQASFRDDLTKNITLRQVQLPEKKLMSEFESLALRYTAKHGFRTYDIMHVAAAICLRCDAFWSFDVKANKLAKLAGLKVLKRK